MLDGPAIDFGRLRYSVTGGIGPLGSDRHDASLTYIVVAAPQPLPPASGKLTVVPWTRNERSAVVGLKTTSYAENVVALARAKEQGAIEAVFGNTRGELCECTGSNVFVVVDGVVLTPPAESGLLLGITRELTIEWGRAAGIEIREADAAARRARRAPTRSSSPARRRTSCRSTPSTTATLPSRAARDEPSCSGSSGATPSGTRDP